MHPLCLLTWLRLGRPRAGSITTHARNTYPFEEGAEVPERLTAAFGDLNVLAAVDLGAGPAETFIGRQIFQVPWRRLISVEAFPAYVEKLHGKQAEAVRHDVFAGRIEHFLDEFKPGDLDLVLLIDVLEHFSRREAYGLLWRIESFFSLGAAIFLPLGRIEQAPYDQNELQCHRSFWRARDLARLGYTVEVHEGLHGQLDPPADAAWAIKRWGPRRGAAE